MHACFPALRTPDPDSLVVELLSHVQYFATPWCVARQVSLSFTISSSLLKLASIESVMPSNHLILCHPLLRPSILPSIRVLTKESALHIRWPKHWRFSVSSSSEYSGLISFRHDWFDLLAVQGTLKSLLQHLYCDSLLSLLFDSFWTARLPTAMDLYLSWPSVPRLVFPNRPASSSPPPASEPALSPCLLSGLELPPTPGGKEPHLSQG